MSFSFQEILLVIEKDSFLFPNREEYKIRAAS